MSRHALRLAALSTVTAVATTTLGLGSMAPARADDSPPPVAVDDTVTAPARTSQYGGVTFVDVLDNDSAPSGGDLEICRVEAPARGLSVAEVAPDGSFIIQTPNGGSSVGGDGSAAPGARESLAVAPWDNRDATFQLTYWACDAEHLTPATVTVKVRKTPEIAVRRTDRPGRLRFTNPRSSRVVVLYGGLRQEEPEGRVRLGARDSETRRVPFRAIRWFAFSPRTGEPLGEGIVRGIQQPAAGGERATSDADLRLSPRVLRAWRSA